MAIIGSVKTNEGGATRKSDLSFHFEFRNLCYMEYEVWALV